MINFLYSNSKEGSGTATGSSGNGRHPDTAPNNGSGKGYAGPDHKTPKEQSGN